ncbi:class II fructose-bisphosphatase [Brevibacillus massiliensis]|jgi:fructose-1,6-bisphosphatase II|uniref:class II fructose-bisphosphatase n=1 Tax=Brevibacillus massiliensis TaxID=1118054 RepID=UPI0002DD97AD|nr:class II fructose-bisphosphatase [Brevibacillus massiliensis]
MKSLMMEFVAVTEAAALASFYWIGRGNKHEADHAATSAMRNKLNQIPFAGKIVIGEGELDQAPMLYIGEKVGTGSGIQCDIAVDPLEGTNLIAKGQSNSITVLAAAEAGALLHAPDMYMEKIVVGPKASGKIDIDAPLMENLQAVAKANGKALQDLTVMVQDRLRHQKIIDTIQQAGGRVHLFSDGDVTCAIAASLEGSGVDMLVGIGGAPEGVVSAVAVKCLGGEMQARLLPQNEQEYSRCMQMGLTKPEQTLTMNQLVGSDECVFAATGVTDSLLLRGVRQGNGDRKMTHSLMLYGKDKTIHYLDTVHENHL